MIRQCCMADTTSATIEQSEKATKAMLGSRRFSTREISAGRPAA